MQIDIDEKPVLNASTTPEADLSSSAYRKVAPPKLGVVRRVMPPTTNKRPNKPLRNKPIPSAYQCSRIRSFRRSDAWLWTEIAACLLAIAIIVPTAIMLWGDRDTRQQQRIAQAWTTIVTPAPGNSGKGAAMEFLASNGISLTGIDLSTDSSEAAAYLIGVDLSGADLVQADMTKADLEDANFSEANLSFAFLENAFLVGADFSRANLQRAFLTQTNLLYANFSGANLEEADFSEASLAKSNLTNAILTNANFSGADLSDAILVGADLSTACGNEWTILPAGVSLPAC